MVNIAPKILFFLTFITFTSRIFMIFITSRIIWEWEICEIFRISIKIELIIEWRRILYSSIVLFISINVLKFSKLYIKIDINNKRFTIIVLLFILSINILIFVPNILCLLIGWDGLGITSFILIIYYNNSRSLSAGILTITVNRLGDAFLLISIRIMINSRNWTTFYLINDIFSFYQLLGIIVAAITKRAQILYSSWLPAAIAAPTTVSALVHSSTLVTAGIFILYRFNKIIINSIIAQSIILLRGILTILVARINAIYENDIKKIIALSTLRQLGLIIIPLAIKIPILRFFHISTHAIFKALLFISAGRLMLKNNHNQDLRLYGISFFSTPVISSAMLISSIALIGISFIRGYYSKHIIITWSSWLPINSIIYFRLLLIIFLTFTYSMRIIIFIGTMPTKKHSIIEQNRSINNKTSLIIMSLARIITGRIIQWFSPLIDNLSLINENIKYIILDFMPITITIYIYLRIKFYYRNQTTTKIFRSLILITPISTQFILPQYLNLSLLLYKISRSDMTRKTIKYRTT